MAATPLSEEQEREAFEALFPIPRDCVWTGRGYSATEYHAWDAHKQCDLWRGWKSRAVLSAGLPKETASEPPIELVGVKEQIAEGSGFWRSCSGCHETNEGYPIGCYPHSDTLGCALGSGCRECGGIGAVWDNIDYEDMAEFMRREDAGLQAFARACEGPRAAPATPPASPTAAAPAGVPSEQALHDMNDALCSFGNRWLMDGDYLRCRKCKRPHIASKLDMEFQHADGCKAAGKVATHPWREFLEIIRPLAARASSPAPLPVPAEPKNGEEGYVCPAGKAQAARRAAPQGQQAVPADFRERFEAWARSKSTGPVDFNSPAALWCWEAAQWASSLAGSPAVPTGEGNAESDKSNLGSDCVGGDLLSARGGEPE